MIAKCDRDGLYSVGRAELQPSVINVLVGCAFGDFQNLADLPSRLSLGNPGENLFLAVRQAERRSVGRLPQGNQGME